MGCAAGFFLEAAAQQWHAVGNELSEYGRQNTVDRSFRVYPGDFLKQEFEEAPFGVVTMWEVLEHLRDPVQACRKVASLLRPEGLFAFTTVDVTSLPARAMGPRWREFVAPHLYYFSLRSLRRLLARASFGLRYWRRQIKRVTLEQAWPVAGMVLRRYGVPLPVQWPFAQAWRTQTIPVPVCDGLFVLAERKR